MHTPAQGGVRPHPQIWKAVNPNQRGSMEHQYGERLISSTWIPDLAHHTIRGSVGIDFPTDHQVQLLEISLSTVSMCRAVSTFTVLRSRRAVRRCPVLWAERDTQQQYPQRKDYIISIVEQTKCPWLHCQGVGPLQHINRGAPFPL